MEGVKDNLFFGVGPGNFFSYYPLYKTPEFLMKYPADDLLVFHAHSENRWYVV